MLHKSSLARGRRAACSEAEEIVSLGEVSSRSQLVGESPG